MNPNPITVRLEQGQTAQITVTTYQASPPPQGFAPVAALLSPPMDAILTYDQCRQWLQMEEKIFTSKVRKGVIPCIGAFGQRVKRFHVRTVLKRLRQLTDLPETVR